MLIANPQGVEAADAQLQLASMQLERGQQLVAQVKKLPGESLYDTQRRTLSQEARVHFAGARDTFENAAATYSAELEKLPPTAASDAETDQASKRQEYRARVAQLRFLAAQTYFETAQSYAPDDDEFRTLHETAAKELSALFDEFARSGSSMVGLYARLYEGRCYQALNQYPMALGCYEDILAQPNVLPAFRKLIASAVHRKAEVLLAQEKLDEAIELCNACLKDAAGEEERSSEWLAVRFRLAQALEKKSAGLSAGSLDQRRLVAEARDAFRFVASAPGEFQSDARTAIGTLARGNGPARRKNQPRFKPRTTWERTHSLPTTRPTSPSPPLRKTIRLPSLSCRPKWIKAKTMPAANFRLATTLIEDDTDPALVTEVRYFLCWLYWEAQDYYRAAVLGEFIARHYPDHAAASSAAKISMASYERLYTQAAAAGSNGKADTDFEARRMANMAEFIARRWPGTPDADTAFGVLVSYAIRNNRIDDAERLVAEASEQSRPRLELQLGNAMWGRYLELSQARDGEAQDAATLEQYKQSALAKLRDGFEQAATASHVNDAAAMAALYLAQAHLSDGQYAEAIALLEDEERGPLTLIAQGHAAATQPQYVMEAYKAALRAYIQISPPQEDKAVEAMKSLEQAVQSRGDKAGEASQQLARIYIAMGVALQKQIDDLTRAGRGAEAKQLTAAFTKFLERIAAQSSELNWPTGVMARADVLQLRYLRASRAVLGPDLSSRIHHQTRDRHGARIPRQSAPRIRTIARGGKDAQLCTKRKRRARRQAATRRMLSRAG